MRHASQIRQPGGPEVLNRTPIDGKDDLPAKTADPGLVRLSVDLEGIDELADDLRGLCGLQNETASPVRATARGARLTAWLALTALTTTLESTAQAPATETSMAEFTLSSSDFTEGGSIAVAQVFTDCDGSNVSPALKCSGAPEATKSFALLVHDPDSPTGSGWWHWIVYNIPATTHALPAGAGDPKKNLMPPGATQGRTDYGNVGYSGPCPQPGKPHHYNFRLYALKVAKLDLPEGASAAAISLNARAQALGTAELTGLYRLTGLHLGSDVL